MDKWECRWCHLDDSVLSIRLQASVQKWDAAVTSVLKAVKPRKLKCGISLVVYVKVKAIMFETKVLESTCHLNLEVSEICTRFTKLLLKKTTKLRT